MTFWCGSGSRSWSADPCLWLTDPDPDPTFFIIDLQDANKKLIYKKFFCILLFEGTFTKDKKVKKKSQKSINQGFSFFLLNDRRIRIRIHTSDWWIRIQIQEAYKHVDLEDPDPNLQHWLKTTCPQYHYSPTLHMDAWGWNENCCFNLT
jgi:hypothetical protein